MTTSKAEQSQRNKRDWSGRTNGGNWGQRFLVGLLGKISGTAAYVLLDIALPFYLPFNRKGFKATRKYFELRLGCDRAESFRKAYATHRLFGQMMFDRFRFYTRGGNEFDVTIDGNESFLAGMESGDGFVIAGSHVGSMEMAGYMLGLKDKPINAVIFGGETASLQSFRKGVLDEHGVKMIPVSDDMSHLFAIKAALDRGEMVSMPCDRMFGSTKGVECDFLGAKAKFPIGAFILAAQLGKDMVALFNLKEGRRGYKVYVRPLEVEREGRSSRQIAQDLVRQYVTYLEEIVRKYPEQWFNFYDFWDLNV